MTPIEARDLATRTLVAIDVADNGGARFLTTTHAIRAADRECVGSDLAGIEDHPPFSSDMCANEAHQPSTINAGWPCPDAARYVDGLRRTAALYGVRP